MSRNLDEIEAHLPEGWTIWPDADSAVWNVGKIDDDFECGGYSVSYLASGQSPAEAISAARAKVDDDEREQAERRADYERRKAAGELTPLEVAGAYIPRIWSSQIVRGLAE